MEKSKTNLVIADKFILLALLLGCLGLYLSPLQAQTVQLTDKSDEYLLGPLTSIYEDKSGQLDLDAARSLYRDGQFKINDKQAVGFGFSKSAYWLQFQVNNLNNRSQNWYLQFTYPLLDDIQVFQVDRSGHVEAQQMGDISSFADRHTKHRTFLFDVELATGETRDVFVRIQTSSSVQAKMILWEKEAFLQANQANQYAFGFYYGVIIAMLVYNLLVFISIRDKIYIYYVAYILSFSLLISSLNGLGYQFLWPDFTWLQGRASAIFMALASFNAILFTRRVLQLNTYLPGWDRLFVNLMYFFGVLTVCTLFVPYYIIGQLCTAAGLLLSILLNAVGWLSLKQENKIAVIYVAAWTLFLVGASIYSLKSYGLLPQMFITEYAMQIGSMLDVVLLSLVLTYRVRLLEEKNIRIQIEARANLEREVKERTKKLNDTLDALSDTYAKVEKLNYTDPLTDIKNRRFFDEFYAHEMNNAIRSNGSIAVLVIDIDHFKTVNDKFGHHAGDRVLCAVSQNVQECLPRKNDFVARYGGDEFVVVLPFTDKEGALLTAKRIKDRISELQVIVENKVITTRISIGLSALIPNKETDMETLIIEADRALYEAKEMGRNRIRCYHDGNISIKDVEI